VVEWLKWRPWVQAPVPQKEKKRLHTIATTKP
jgi:hypothetical protein